MSHIHDVTDDDLHFIIDPDTRAITYGGEKQPMLIENDHNSEKFTFEVPKIIDGHDVTTCNLVRVHFINISLANPNEFSASLYEVEDVAAMTNDPNTASFTWLIAQEATKYPGTVSFLVEFACKRDTESGPIIDYSWHSAIYEGVIVSDGMDNSDVVIGTRYDVLDTWVKQFEDRLDAYGVEITKQVSTAGKQAISNLEAQAEIIKNDMAIDVLSTRGILTQVAGNDPEKIMSQKATTEEINALKGRIDNIINPRGTAEYTRHTEILNFNDVDGYVVQGEIAIVGPEITLTVWAVQYPKTYTGVDVEVSLGYLPYSIKPTRELKYGLYAGLGDGNSSPGVERYVYLIITTEGEVKYLTTKRAFVVEFGSLDKVVSYTNQDVFGYIRDRDGNVSGPVEKFLCLNEKMTELSIPELTDLRVDRHGVTHDTARDAIVGEFDAIAETTESLLVEVQNGADAARENAGRISRNDKRITNLERGITPDPFETDSSVARMKVVPDGVLPYAEVNKIGGMTRKCRNRLPYPYSSKDSTTSNGVTFTVNPDHSITINGTPTGAAATFNLYVNKATQDIIRKDSAYSISLYGSHNKNSIYISSNISIDSVNWSGGLVTTAGVTTKTFDVTEDYTGIQFYLVIPTSAGTINNITVYPMLNEGSTALPFEPYYEGLRDTKVTAIRAIGKNYAKTNMSEANTFSSATIRREPESSKVILDGTCSSVGAYDMARDIVLPAGTYTASVKGLNEADNERLYIGTTVTRQVVVNNIAPSTPQTFTLTEPTSIYVTWVTATGSTYANTPVYLQIERGTTATEWEDYTYEELEIPTEVQELDGYGEGVPDSTYRSHIAYDEHGNVTWNRMVHTVEYDGSSDESMWKYSNGDSWALFGIKLPIDATGLEYPPAVINWSTPYIRKYSHEYGELWYVNDVTLVLAISVSKANTVEELRAYLEAHPLRITYALPVPIVTDISDRITTDNFLKVVSGGAIEAVNEYGYDAPVEVTYQLKEATE